MTDTEVVQQALVQLVKGERTPAELMGVPPRIVNGLYAMGMTASDRGRYVMADNIFQRCLRLDPFRADFWLALAITRQTQERFEEAGEMFQIAGLLTDDIAPVAYAAACLAQAGQVDRARVLADFVRADARPSDQLEPWLAIVNAATDTEETRS